MTAELERHGAVVTGRVIDPYPETCRVFWGSHGCDRPRGHLDDLHPLGGHVCEEGDDVDERGTCSDLTGWDPAHVFGADWPTPDVVCGHPNRLGHEVRGVYDGVLWWSCLDCLHAWPAWTDGRRGDIAAQYVGAYLQGASDAQAKSKETP